METEQLENIMDKIRITIMVIIIIIILVISFLNFDPKEKQKYPEYQPNVSEQVEQVVDSLQNMQMGQ